MQSFPAEYQARYLDEWPSGNPDLVVTTGDRGPERLVEVDLPDGSTWTVAVTAPCDASRRAVTGLYATPCPGRLLAVARGAPYLLSVVPPRQAEVIETDGPVIAVRPVNDMDLLLLCTDWTVIALGRDGVAWRTVRLSIEGIRIDETEGDRARGVADPDSDEPRDFMIDLNTGQVLGETHPF